jgi:hypothetical protein
MFCQKDFLGRLIDGDFTAYHTESRGFTVFLQHQSQTGRLEQGGLQLAIRVAEVEL